MKTRKKTIHFVLFCVVLLCALSVVWATNSTSDDAGNVQSHIIEKNVDLDIKTAGYSSRIFISVLQVMIKQVMGLMIIHTNLCRRLFKHQIIMIR